MLLHGRRGGLAGAGAGRLPRQPSLALSAAPSLEQKICWLAVKQPVSQKRRRGIKKQPKPKKGERSNNKNNTPAR